MPKNPKQKQKLLYVMQYLSSNTDEDYGVTVGDIIDYLDERGIKAERKSIYDDIETLRDYGMDIVKTKVGKASLYSLVSRDFEIAELKLLVDAVQSSKFITKSKSASLIKKIEGLASVNDAKKLHRQVIVADRVKTSNERVYYNIDAINDAINAKKQIAFYYTQWAITDSGPKRLVRVRRHDGKRYQVSPKALSWDDENYYLIALDTEEDKVKHYRVDKMENIEILSERSKASKSIDSIDMAAYSKQIFGMFGGELTGVRLRFDNRLIGVVVDRFSERVFISPNTDGTFTVATDVMLSPQFYGWLFSFGDQAKILSPKKAKDGFVAYLDSVRDAYEKK